MQEIKKILLRLWCVSMLGFTLAGCRTHTPSLDNAFVVVVDAGHGGNDQGAAGRRSMEKDIKLSVAKRVCKQLKKVDKHIVVLQTRPTDEFVTLADRAGMANYYNAHLFISIHSNAAREWAMGTETFVHHNAKGTSAHRLASLIEQEYQHTAHRQSRGVKTANFHVLKNTKMPAVLTEIGFITHKDEEKFIRSRKGQKKIAHSIRKAFEQYYFESKLKDNY